jgi:hypothetical protein
MPGACTRCWATCGNGARTGISVMAPGRKKGLALAYSAAAPGAPARRTCGLPSGTSSSRRTGAATSAFAVPGSGKGTAKTEVFSGQPHLFCRPRLVIPARGKLRRSAKTGSQKGP